MKKEYEALEIEIKNFAVVDIMSVSTNDGIEDGDQVGDKDDF